jgi:hypothetical protein
MNMAKTAKTMRYLIYLTLFLSTSLSAGSIHKWVDDDGNVHYGDAPPVSAETEGVRVQSAPSNPGKALPRLSSPDSSTTAEDSPASDDNPPATANNDEVPADQARIACESAREDLQVIGRSSRIKLRSADGSTRYMTGEEIEERRRQADEDIKRFCK